MPAIKQWGLAVLAVLGAFFVAGVAGSVASDLLGLWHLPGAGFVAAFAVVVTTYVAAPDRKVLLSCATFIVGAIAAWILLEPSWYPDTKRYGSLAYKDTHLPVIATYFGGLIGLAVVGILRTRTGA
ncbi:MAG: hypothetical protein ACJ8GV_13245 [Luteimonas sp.]